MPSSQLQCSGRQGRRWAWWFCCGCPWISLWGWTLWKGSWTGLPSLLLPGTSGGPKCGCLSIPGTPGQLPGCSWNHCGNGQQSPWFKRRKLTEPFLLAVLYKYRHENRFPSQCEMASLSNRTGYKRKGGSVAKDATNLTDRSESALITMVLARSTWAAAVTLLRAMTRSCGFTRAAACSPKVILPEELFSIEP